MSVTRPTEPPAEIRAGSTLWWSASYGDFPASTWTLTYTLRGPAKYTITATASGDTHHVDVVPATTAAYLPGNYTLLGEFTDGTDVYPLPEGPSRFVITEDLAQSSSAFDARSWNEQIVDAIKAVIEGRASRVEENYEVGFAGHSQKLSLLSFEELNEALRFYEARVDAEKRREAVAKGKSAGRQIVTRFVNR